MSLLLVQMAGPPGVGKSTFAVALAHRLDAQVFDTDVVKSALLDGGVPWDMAGAGGYATVRALADQELRKGRSVVLDTPSHYAEIPEHGVKIAADHGARYVFVELRCSDLVLLKERLALRRPLRSQMPSMGMRPPDADRPTRAVATGTHQWITARPASPVLIMDVERGTGVDLLVEQAVSYIEGGPHHDGGEHEHHPVFSST